MKQITIIGLVSLLIGGGIGFTSARLSASEEFHHFLIWNPITESYQLSIGGVGIFKMKDALRLIEVTPELEIPTLNEEGETCIRIDPSSHECWEPQDCEQLVVEIIDDRFHLSVFDTCSTETVQLPIAPGN